MGQILGEKVDIRRKHNLSFFVYLWPFLCRTLFPFAWCSLFDVKHHLAALLKKSAHQDQPLDQWPQVLTLEHIINQIKISSGTGVASKHQNKSYQHWNLAFISFKIIQNHNMWHFAEICTLLLRPNDHLLSPLCETYIKWTNRNGFYKKQKNWNEKETRCVFSNCLTYWFFFLPFRLNPNEEHLKRNFRHSIGWKCIEPEWIAAKKWNEKHIKFIMHGGNLSHERNTVWKQTLAYSRHQRICDWILCGALVCDEWLKSSGARFLSEPNMRRERRTGGDRALANKQTKRLFNHKNGLAGKNVLQLFFGFCNGNHIINARQINGYLLSLALIESIE